MRQLHQILVRIHFIEFRNSQQNPDLTNELTTEFEVGDLVMFNNRLAFDAMYYDRTTEDQIFNVPLPSPTGYTSRTLNAGEMRNWGWEFQVKGTPIKQNDLKLDLGLNLSFINNEVVELLKDDDGNSVVENISIGSTWAVEVRVQKVILTWLFLVKTILMITMETKL